MALQTINVGNFVNDGTGDDLRTAFVKVNENFDEIDLRGGQNNDVRVTGTGIPLYKEKVGEDLYFKSILAGDGIAITQNGTNTTATMITIASKSTVPVSTQTPAGIEGKLWYNSTTNRLKVYHSSAWVDANPASVSYILENDTAPKLGANLLLNGHNIQGNGTVYATTVGNHQGTVYGIEVRNLNRDVTSFDFGAIGQNIPQNFMQWLKQQYSFDLGTFVSPAAVNIDVGSIV
jgi:hypothetical protein